MGPEFHCIFTLPDFHLDKGWTMHGVLMRYNDRCPSGQQKKSTSRDSGHKTEAVIAIECAFDCVDFHVLIQTDF